MVRTLIVRPAEMILSAVQWKKFSYLRKCFPRQ
jgi:hypothetical protein